MVVPTSKVAAALLVVCTLVLGACTPAPQEAAEPAAAEPARPELPAYRSAKHVSTDCGPVYNSAPPSGYMDIDGKAFGEMPPHLKARNAVGADRPLAETDAERVSPGLVMIEPGYVKEAFLINNDKEVVATFENDYYSFTQLMDDGTRLANSILYSEVFDEGGGNRGCLEEYGPDGNLNYRWRLESDKYVQHHDMVKLPNGNILTLVWEQVSADEAIAMGRNPDHVAENGNHWYDGVIEIDPRTGKIVWEWSMKHHLVQDLDSSKANYGVVEDNPGKLDINAIQLDPDGKAHDDWTHANALDYNAELDQIIFSLNHLSEVYVIDHSTAPYESHTDAGDFLYRWGNVENYKHGGDEDRTLFAQHDVHWIPDGLPGAGNIMIFNNGYAGAREYTTVVELAPEMNADGSYVLGDDGAYGPTELFWEYDPPEEERFFSWFISGAQRLPNGNTLVNHGAMAKLREVTSDGEIVWEYAYGDPDAPPHMLFRAYRYPEDHPAIVAILGQQ